MSIKELAELVHKNAMDKGFHPSGESDAQYLAQFCNNEHGEVSELWEAWRLGKIMLMCDKRCGLTCLEEELADIVIRALDAAERLDVDIERALLLKHEYNTTRDFRHGNKLA